MSTKNDPGDSTTAPTHVRYMVLVLIGLAPACAYLTRIISAFNTTIEAEFQIAHKDMGEVIAGFALGYFLFQVPGGLCASAFGVRVVLPVMGLAWSLCAILGGFAQSADQLYWSRVLMGIAQAGLVPCCAKVAADWFPVSRRGLVSAVLTASMQVGAIVATGLSAGLLDSAGWRVLLVGYAIFGISWAAAFFFWFRNRPEEHPSTNAKERALIRAGRQPAEAETSPSADWKRFTVAMCFSVSVWAFLIQALCRAYGYGFFTAWFPAFLEKALGLQAAQAGQWATVPLVALFAGAMSGGLLVDWVLIRSGNRWLSRSGTSVLALSLCAGCFALATLSTEPIFVVSALSLGSFAAAIGGPTTWAAGMDLGGRHTAVVFGVMNMIGNVGAYFSPIHVGKLFDYVEETHGNWNLILWLFVGIHLAGAMAWIFVNPRRPAVALVPPAGQDRSPTHVSHGKAF